MKMNFTSPIWLQSASSKPQVLGDIKLFFSSANAGMKITANGIVTVTAIVSGKKVVSSHENLSNTTVDFNNDAGTNVWLSGEITVLSDGQYGTYPGTSLKSIDFVSNAEYIQELKFEVARIETINLSMCTGLTKFRAVSGVFEYLDFDNNTELTSIDVAGCKEIKTLRFSNCNKVTSVAFGKTTTMPETNMKFELIEAVVPTQDVCDGIINSLNGIILSGTPTLRLKNGYEFNDAVEEAAQSKGWIVEYME